MIPTADSLPYGTLASRDWSVVPLKHLATLMNGYGFKSDSWKDSGTPIIRIENLNGSDVFNYSDINPGDRFLVSQGDLLYSWSGNPGTSFGPFVWNARGRYYLNQHIFRVDVHGCDKNWLYWALKAATHWIERELTSGMIGMVHVTKSELSNVPIPIPPPADQRRIADFLAAEIARIENLYALRARNSVVLAELAAGVTAQAFDLHGSPHPRLGYFVRIQSGITVDASRDATAESVTRPYLRVANVQAGRLDLGDVAELTVPRRLASAARLIAGDVLMTEGGDLDKLGRGTVWEGQIPDCLHQNHVFAVRPDREHLDSQFLAFYTQTPAARRHFESTGTKTTNLASTSSSKIRELRIPLPDLKLQRYVVKNLQANLENIAELTTTIALQRKLLSERRQALITAAVTGQFDVTTARGVDPS